MKESDKLYYRGTIFDVSYEWDGWQESHRAILAELHEDDFVFQVIQINEHHAGCVDGWIHLQFEHVNAVTYDFLYQELLKQCYPIIHKLEMVEENAETITEYLKFQKRHGFWENPLALHVPSIKDV